MKISEVLINTDKKQTIGSFEKEINGERSYCALGLIHRSKANNISEFTLSKLSRNFVQKVIEESGSSYVLESKSKDDLVKASFLTVELNDKALFSFKEIGLILRALGF